MNKWQVNEDLKIRLNLSHLALGVIEQDRINFRAKSRTQFLNRVFLHMYSRSGASIARQLELQKEQYVQLLSSLSLTQAQRDSVISCLLESMEDSLKNQHTKHEKAHEAFSHTLSEEVVQILYDAKKEQKYYTAAQYFKAVIEDYCLQSVCRREEIYFADYFTDIENAIAQKRQLVVCCAKGTRYLVHPYQIITDPQCTSHYLVCYGRTPKQNITDKVPYSMRISHIVSLRANSDHAFLSEADKKNLDEAVQKQGVQFLAGTLKQIQVQLTPRGVTKLNRHSTLRPPQACPPQDNVYTFLCTETQAEYYFLKLGDDAQILSPARLRNKFARLHARAAAAYAEEKP